MSISDGLEPVGCTITLKEFDKIVGESFLKMRPPQALPTLGHLFPTSLAVSQSKSKVQEFFSPAPSSANAFKAAAGDALAPRSPQGILESVPHISVMDAVAKAADLALDIPADLVPRGITYLNTLLSCVASTHKLCLSLCRISDPEQLASYLRSYQWPSGAEECV